LAPRLIDNRITEQFRAFGKSLFRKEDVKHKGALDGFAKTLAHHKKSLAARRKFYWCRQTGLPVNRTKVFLESEGYHATLVATVAEAEAIAQQAELRLLLSDAQLEDGTAFDVYAKVCQFHPDIEFLVISSANAVDIALEAMEREPAIAFLSRTRA